MKARMLVGLTVLVLFVALATMAFAPMRLPAQEGGLTESQLWIVAIVGSAVLWLLRLAVQKGYQPTKEVVAIALYVVSFALALLFNALVIPPFPAFNDAPTFVRAFLEYIETWLALVSPYVGIAFLIYNVLLQRILEGAKARAQKFLQA